MRTAVHIAPAEEPVSLAEAKAHIRLSSDLEDALVGAVVKAARLHAEKITERAFVTQTLRLTLSASEGVPPLVLPYGPVQSVAAFEVFDLEGDAWVAADASAYALAGDRLVRSERAGAAAWPAAERTHDAYRITYVAGYGAAADVPADIKQAVLLLAADLYENRETMVGSGLVVTNMPLSAKVLLAPYVNYQLS